MEKLDNESNKILILGGKVITMENQIIEDGSVYIKNNEIKFVGTKEEGISFKDKDVKVIDGENKYILPGFMNMHCHLFQVLLRTYGSDLNLLDWLNKVIWPVLPKMSSNDIRTSTELAVLENIKSGVTTLIDMNYGNPHHETVLNVFNETGIRGYLSRGFYEVEAKDIMIEESNKALEDTERLMKKYDNVMPGPMHPVFVSNDSLKELKRLSDKYDRNFYIHLAESKEDVELLKEKRGFRDAELLKKLGILDNKFIGVHSIQLNENEVRLLGETNSNTVHCPTSNMYVNDGISPISKLKDLGANVTIATDGPASTGKQDYFSEMKTASLLQKVHYDNPEIISAPDILKMSTKNGAKALGINSGSLKKGKLADITILDMNKPNTVHAYDPKGSVVYSASPNNVDTVIANGQILMENKEVKVLNEKEILQKAKITAEKLTK